jgi:kumamolisin
MQSSPADLNQEISISIYLRNDTHENGMTLEEYTDAVIAGTQPVLEHDQYVYQFGAVSDEWALVEEWAIKNSLEIIESDLGMAVVKLKGRVEQFNNLFSIQLLTVTTETRTYITHEGDITLPSEINDVVSMVLGLDNSMQVSSFIKGLDVTADSTDPTPAPNTYPNKYPVNPRQVATAYQVPPGDGYGQTIAIIEFQGSGWNQADVNRTFAQVGLTPPQVTNYSVDGATFTTVSDAETMMDIYCAGGVCPKSNIVVYYAPNTSQGFYNMVNAIANDTVNNPSVLTVSWGYSGDLNDYLAVPFQACITKGILVFFSSGDDGGNNWQAEYPASSRYVIAAGGTSIYLNPNNTLNTETVWSGSGGGISTFSTLPTWQANPSLYYRTYSKTGALGAPTQIAKRGVPDISAPADPYTGYQFYVNGSINQNGGTSASAPFLAGVFARLNQMLGRRVQFGEIMNLLYGSSNDQANLPLPASITSTASLIYDFSNTASYNAGSRTVYDLVGSHNALITGTPTLSGSGINKYLTLDATSSFSMPSVFSGSEIHFSMYVIADGVPPGSMTNYNWNVTRWDYDGEPTISWVSHGGGGMGSTTGDGSMSGPGGFQLYKFSISGVPGGFNSSTKKSGATGTVNNGMQIMSGGPSIWDTAAVVTGGNQNGTPLSFNVKLLMIFSAASDPGMGAVVDALKNRFVLPGGTAIPSGYFTCTDVTVGYNNYSWHGLGSVNGYAATTGWDAATGLGSPIVSIIYKLLHNGTTFPKLNYGFRPTSGTTFPRRTTGAR